MVKLAFQTKLNSETVAALTVSYGERMKIKDFSHGAIKLDFSFPVYSPYYRHEILFADDQEEWARNVPAHYHHPQYNAVLLEDNEALFTSHLLGALPPPATSPSSYPPPKQQLSPIETTAPYNDAAEFLELVTPTVSSKQSILLLLGGTLFIVGLLIFLLVDKIL